jgi:adenylosuccinate synthase
MSASVSSSIQQASKVPDCTCVVGLQWGDEAKGKLVDLLGDQHDFVVRYNGGANAGHTIVWGDRKFKLSLLPAGVLKPNLKSVIGNGVVVYPPRFLEEIEQLTAAGISVGSNLALSDHAHVIFPYHLEAERLSESGGEGAIGTTGRGIGPCYQDKVGRMFGIRVGDLLRPDYLRERLRMIVPQKNRINQALANGRETKPFDAERVATDYLALGKKIAPFVTDTTHLLHRGLRSGKRILFEGAQGSLLDVDHGTYPFVTSSNSSPAGIWSGSGVPARYVNRIVGVVKAYSSRVGHGPFPTELSDGPDGLGEKIRKTGREYGTVTGRPRRVGWLDLVATRYSAALAGADEIAIMLLDVLSCVNEIGICTGYEIDGKRGDEFPADSHLLERVKPTYVTMPGWGVDISRARKLADLPDSARRYLDRIASLLGLPITIVSVGPDRDQTIIPQ